MHKMVIHSADSALRFLLRELDVYSSVSCKIHNFVRLRNRSSQITGLAVCNREHRPCLKRHTLVIHMKTTT